MKINIAILILIELFMVYFLVTGLLKYHRLRNIPEENLTQARIVDKYYGNKLFEGYRVRYKFFIEDLEVIDESRVTIDFWKEATLDKEISVYFSLTNSTVLTRLSKEIDATKWTYYTTTPIWMVVLIIYTIFLSRLIRLEKRRKKSTPG